MLHFITWVMVANEQSTKFIHRYTCACNVYNRAITGESRLNGLAMLNIHRDIEISTDAVLDELSKSSRRINIKL